MAAAPSNGPLTGQLYRKKPGYGLVPHPRRVKEDKTPKMGHRPDPFSETQEGPKAEWAHFMMPSDTQGFAIHHNALSWPEPAPRVCSYAPAVEEGSGKRGFSRRRRCRSCGRPLEPPAGLPSFGFLKHSPSPTPPPFSKWRRPRRLDDVAHGVEVVDAYIDSATPPPL